MQSKTTSVDSLARSATATLVLLGLMGSAAVPGIIGQDPVEMPEKERVETPRPGLARGDQAPRFSLTTTDKIIWTLGQQSAEVVVLEWIDGDCPVVKRQHSPEGTIRLESLRTAEDPRVSWLAIDSKYHAQGVGAQERAARIREALLIDYPVAADPTGWVGRAYGAVHAGHVVVLDSDAKVIYAGAPDDQGRGQILGRAIDEGLGLKPLDVPTIQAQGCVIPYAAGVKLGAALPPMVFSTSSGTKRWTREMVGAAHVIEWFNPACPTVASAHGNDGALNAAMTRWKELGGEWTLVNSAPAGHRTTGEANQAAMQKWGLNAALALDPNKALADLFQPTVTPHLFVTDARGVLIYAGGHTDQEKKSTRPLQSLMDDMEAADTSPVKPRSTTAWGTPLVN